jgi:hypothetical protein
LAAPAELERICKGLATLDAIVEDDWESRYYSFNAAWNKKKQHRLASMRNGEGDDWFIVFTPKGTFVKSFWHEYDAEDADEIYEGLPKDLASQRKENAFSMDEVTFGGWHDGKTWTLRGNAEPMADELAMLTGAAKNYRSFASGYYDLKLPLDAIEHVLAGKKLDQKLVAKINAERTLAELKPELAEIGY